MRNFKKQFGGKVTSEHRSSYERSPNWKDGKFQNLEETDMSLSFWEISELLYKQMCDKTQREPKTPLPVAAFNKDDFMASGDRLRFTWYGHSATLMRLDELTIMIDPMLGSNASPIAPYKTGRFADNTLEIIDDLPPIDLMVLSHDHYDHLDLDSITKLEPKTKRYMVALGVKRHLVKWGVAPEKITEFDWWDEEDISSIKVTFTPSRHFSGRGLTDRAKSLWGGWVFSSATENVWFSGDGGYGDHFKAIGERLGPFDLGFMECGQYDSKWSSLHMFPEESVIASIDAQVKLAMPVHWCGFALAQHKWNEPAEDFYQYADKHQVATIIPRLGELIDLAKTYESTKWWINV